MPGNKSKAKQKPKSGKKHGPRKGLVDFVPGTESANGKAHYAPSKKDRVFVQTLSSLGMPQQSIARKLGIAINTLRTHFEEELAMALDDKNVEVAKALFTNATRSGNVTAQIFWLRTRAGWRNGMNLGANDEGHPFDYTQLNAEELRMLAYLMEKAAIKKTIIDMPGSLEEARRG